MKALNVAVTLLKSQQADIDVSVSSRLSWFPQ